MTIRAARLEDEDAIVALGAVMHAEAPAHRGSVYSADRARATFRRLLTDSQNALILVGERGGEVVGLFVGVHTEHWCIDESMTADLVLYVHPAHRGGLLGPRLIREYIDWAGDRGASRVLISTSTLINTRGFGRLMTGLGFTEVGVGFQLRLREHEGT